MIHLTKQNPIQVDSGITSGRTRFQVEQFYKQYPEWANLISFIMPAGRYRVLRASAQSLSVDFVEPNWRLTVHKQAPDYWAAEIYDLDKCSREPEVYIAPLVHIEGENKVEVVGSALQAAIETLDGSIEPGFFKVCE